jgi:hypothetical protein
LARPDTDLLRTMMDEAVPNIIEGGASRMAVYHQNDATGRRFTRSIFGNMRYEVIDRKRNDRKTMQVVKYRDGHGYLQLADALGTLFTDDLFVSLYGTNPDS